jgi:hypothetical protein
MNAGEEIILVSSGAIGMGVGKLRLEERPHDIAAKQACAAVGQCELMYTYDKLFSEYSHTVAQILLTAPDLSCDDRRGKFVATTEKLLSFGVLPIINENDTVATEEIEFGDNDTLAAIVGLEGVEAVGNDRICRVGELPEEMDAVEFINMLKERLSSGRDEKEAHIALCPAGKRVKRVALVGGGGGGEIGLASSVGADTYITGELKHHERLSATDLGMNLVCAGHFFTENPVCEFLKKTVEEICPDASAEVIFSNAVIEI